MMDRLADWFNNTLPAYWWLWIILLIIVIFLVRFLRVLLFKKARLRRIDRMTGEEFERYLAMKYKDMGYRVRQTQKTGDYGADLILTDKKRKEKIVVQAKRYNKNVGVEAVQQVSAARLHYDADKAYVVTNSYFTRGAETLAATNDVLLFDRDWIEEAVKKRVSKADEDAYSHPDGEPLEIRFERTVISPDGRTDTKESVERILEEYLIEQGYEIVEDEEIEDESRIVH